MFDGERDITRRATIEASLNYLASHTPDMSSGLPIGLGVFTPDIFDFGIKGAWSNPFVKVPEGMKLAPFFVLSLSADPKLEPQTVNELVVAGVGSQRVRYSLSQEDVYSLSIDQDRLPVQIYREQSFSQSFGFDLRRADASSGFYVDAGSLGPYDKKAVLIVDRQYMPEDRYRFTYAPLPKLDWESIRNQETGALDLLTAPENEFFASQKRLLMVFGQSDSDPLQATGQGDLRIKTDVFGEKPVFVESSPGGLSLVTYSDRRLRDDVMGLGRTASPELVQEMIRSQGSAGFKIDFNLKFGEIKASMYEMHRKRDGEYVGRKELKPDGIDAIFNSAYLGDVSTPLPPSVGLLNRQEPVSKFVPSRSDVDLLNRINSIPRRNRRRPRGRGH